MAKELGRTITYNISKGKLPCICNISDICKSINYTFEEFRADYLSHLSKFPISNHYLVYKIYISGYNFVDYAKVIGVSRGTIEYIKLENFGNLNANFIWKIKWLINKDTLSFESKIEFIQKTGYAKIIGNIDTLEELKELYSIPYPVLFYSNDLWHIAFWWINK